MLKYLCACYIQNWAALPMAQRGGGSSLRGLFEVQVIRVDCNISVDSHVIIVTVKRECCFQNVSAHAQCMSWC